LESAAQEVHDELEREKHIRGEVEKAKRKLEGDLKVCAKNTYLCFPEREFSKKQVVKQSFQLSWLLAR